MSAAASHEEIDPTLKAIRKGAKSCRECRHRKTRCVWPYEGAGRCESCVARGKKCEAQIHKLPSSSARRATLTARVNRLDGEMKHLRSVLQVVETKVGVSPSLVNHDATSPHSATSSSHQHEHLSHHMEDESDSDFSEVSLDPPGHWHQLFDNGLLDSSEKGKGPHSRHLPSINNAQSCLSLRELLPSRADLLRLVASAGAWLPLYKSFIPILGFAQTGQHMVWQYDRVQESAADVYTLASMLLSIAIIAQHSSDQVTEEATEVLKDTPAFVKEVSDRVESIVVADDNLASSLEGLETSLLFIRLQMSRAQVRKIWLLSRRLIALAELVGLPRASNLTASNQITGPDDMTDRSGVDSDLLSKKAAIWESICTVDRMTSMMWSLPLGTAEHVLPKRPLVDQTGQVNPTAYLYTLANSATRILELDNVYFSGRPLSELADAVTGVDHELRLLVDSSPAGWQQSDDPPLSIESLIKYWHQYFLLRTHLQLALSHRSDQPFPFSFQTCLEACTQVVRRYVLIRPVLPGGFFATRVIDLQAFTATVFLLLAGHRYFSQYEAIAPATVDVDAVLKAVDQVTVVMRAAAAARVGGHLTRQAADAVQSLSALLRQREGSQQAQEIVLSVPLVGKIRVSRRANNPTRAAQVERPPPVSASHPVHQSHQHSHPDQQWRHHQRQGGPQHSPQQPQSQVTIPSHSINRGSSGTSSDIDMQNPITAHSNTYPVAADQTLRSTSIDPTESYTYLMEMPDIPFPMFAEDSPGMDDSWLTWTTGWDQSGQQRQSSGGGGRS